MDSAALVGPQPQETKEVLLIIGPGMANALSGIGVIRALSEEGIKISGIVGVEFGAFVAISYATASSLNQMEWPILQFKKEWITPAAGFSRLFSSGKKSPTEFYRGVERLFLNKAIESARVPFWAIGIDQADDFYGFSRGPIPSALCQVIASPVWMSHCPAGEFVETRVATLRETWLTAGLRLPVIWVISPQSKLETSTTQSEPEESILKMQQAFRKQVLASAGPEDLQIYPPVVLRDSFAFERRSEVVFSAKREALLRIREWAKSLGWSKETESK
ncbi:MAG: hypothetical protein KGQ59_08545 [Bdellovibrionales bacterium]|nr:hypothetical protein [Bdellovibrionales bacterium]